MRKEHFRYLVHFLYCRYIGGQTEMNNVCVSTLKRKHYSSFKSMHIGNSNVDLDKISI